MVKLVLVIVEDLRKCVVKANLVADVTNKAVTHETTLSHCLFLGAFWGTHAPAHKVILLKGCEVGGAVYRRLLITAARCAESPEPVHILTDNGMLVRSPDRK